MKPERNAPCPCGSGLKYKKCHGLPGSPPLPSAEPVAGSWRARLQPRQLFDAALDHHRAGELDAAAALYAELLVAHPDNPDVLLNLGLIELHRGQAEQALQRLQAALRTAPARADLQAKLGAALVVMQRHDEAIAQLAPLADQGRLDAAGRRSLAVALVRRGRASAARRLLEQVIAENPADAEAQAALGNVCTDLHDHAAAQAAYAAALERRPDSAEWLSNRLLALQYDPTPDLAQLRALHRQTGRRLQGIWPALPAPFTNDPDPARRLRVGVLSPDLGEHPVGQLAAPWLLALDPAQVELVLYPTRPRDDALAQALRARAARWVPVHADSDAELLARLRGDRIDVLIDLAGHTAGNRLAVLARRAAPVQLSGVGYPDTTGLDVVDLRLSDGWLEPGDDPPAEGTEPAWLRLEGGLYRCLPPRLAPPVAEPPRLRLGRPSFGVFGNVAKFSDQAVAWWAEVLRASPQARLVVKAAGMADAAQVERLQRLLQAGGVDPGRLLVLPWSDHAEHLQAYAEVDVMLDSWPFNMAGNSVEALWMGVPVLSLSAPRPAGRQGASLLHGAGLAQWAFDDRAAWVAAAAALADDVAALQRWRQGLRQHLQGSALFDGAGAARQIEAACRRAWQAWCAAAPAPRAPLRVLHVGSGHPEAGKLPPPFAPALWRELRVDIDPRVQPDYVASMTDMSAVPDASADALYSSHNLEHLRPQELPVALAEFRRVLKPGGFVLATLPDLEDAARALLRDGLEAPLYESPAGPVSAFDMFFGHRDIVTRGNDFMLHKQGFTASTLKQAFERAGYQRVQVASQRYALWALAFVPD